MVTGTLGGSLLGRHLRPVPRVREVERLMEFCRSLPDMPRPSAMMDLSDGLALDLARLCRESGVGALVDAAAVPIDPAAREASAASGRTALAHALTDGEDFEVLVTLAPAVWTAFTGFLTTPAGQAAFRDLAPFRRIGELTAEAGIRLRHEGGEQPLAAEGYEHTW
ncbi:MAG: hypothetical protein LIP77_04025 [Planctomycetes bacterium]|nr:hypothetical protein [Planctomycetota bacterium]